MSKNSNSKLWEETIYLLQARDNEEARHKGEVLGKQAQTEFESISGEQVKWVFDRVFSIYEINQETIGEGTEVFSRFLRDAEVNSLLTPFGDEEY